MREVLYSLLTVGTEAFLGWLTCFLYFRPLPRREHFWLRAGGMLLLAVAVGGQVQWLLPLSAFQLVVPALLPVLGVLLGKVSWKVEFGTAVYLSIWGILTYFLLYEIWEVLSLLLLPGAQAGDLLKWLLRLVLAGVVYLPLGLTVRRWMPVYITGHVGPRQTVSAVFLYLIFVALLGSFYEQGTFQPRRFLSILVFMGQIYAMTVLYLQTALFRQSAMQQELDAINLLWHQQKAQYQMSKETIDLINRKCHDLKHQVAAMRTMSSGEGREQYLREIEDSVQIYDCMVKTGNETLDTVLTEKSLLCEASGITVNCVADGTQVSFMDPVDLYTILGNALDNAMEGVKNLLPQELRVIDVLIHVRQRFLVMTVTNPLKDSLTFQDGLPVSRKPKDGYHGYGMRSIRHTVHKYGGEMTVEAEGGCFSLRLMIPLPSEEAQ